MKKKGNLNKNVLLEGLHLFKFLSQDTLRTFALVFRMTVQRVKYLCVVLHIRHTLIQYLMSASPGSRKYHLYSRVRIQTTAHSRGMCQRRLNDHLLDFTVIYYMLVKICLVSLSIKILGEILQFKPTLPIKYFNFYLKQNTTCKPCETWQEAVPARGIIYLHQVFNTVSSSQSDNRVRKLN